MNKKVDYEVWLTIGLHGIAITDLHDPDGIIEIDLNLNGIYEWFDRCIEPLAEGGLETGAWHLKGTILVTEDDCRYTVDYAMPD